MVWAALAVAGACCAPTTSAAVSITWNGGAGATWNTAAANWLDASGTPWNAANGSTNTAVFDTAGASAVVSGTVTTHAIMFSRDGGISGGTISLAGGSPTITTAATGSIGSILSGSAGIVKAGTGTLLLRGTNTLTGGIVLQAGTLGIWEATALGSVPGSPTTQLTFAGDSTLQFQQTPAALPINANRLITLGGGIGTIDVQGFSIPFNSVFSGSGGLRKTGVGTLTLNGSSTYGGGTTIDSGTLKLGHASALGSSAGRLQINPGGRLNLAGFSPTVGVFGINNGLVLGFNATGTPNGITASSASVSGTNYLLVTATATGTTTLISAAGGGLAGTFMFDGAQDLTVPATRMITKSGSTFLRLQLENSGTAERLVVTNPGTANLISIMPLGASIAGGYSTTGTAQNGQVVSSYNGGGYHTQLYQRLVNDGRFVPNFVGNITTSYSVSASGSNLLQYAGQTQHEGHATYTTSQILWNLNHDDGNASNNGGFWLSGTNANTGGLNAPDYVPVYGGGNDFGVAALRNTTVVDRYDAILTEIHSLRPGAATVATTLMYRTDVGSYQNSLFNPYVEGTVYDHVLAGEDVRFLDLYTLLTPGNVITNVVSKDGIHPTQDGYNMMADAIHRSIAYGAAYWTGDQGGNWGTVTGGTNTNWALDRSGTYDRQVGLNAAPATDFTDPYGTANKIYPDVFFVTSGSLATTVDADTTIRSLNFAAGASNAVVVGGTRTLTIGSGGITVQEGTGVHTLSAPVALAANQTWGNVSANDFTVSGAVTGSASLTIAGAFTINSLTTLTSGTSYTTEVANTQAITTTGSGGAIVLAGNNVGYSGTTTVLQYGRLKLGHANALGGASASLNLAGGVVDLAAVSPTVGLLTGSSGTITTTSAATVGLTVGTSSSGTYSGVITNGAGVVGIRKVGSGTLTISGSMANTNTGTTTIGAGMLVLAKPAGVTAVAGNIQLGDGAGTDVLRLGASNQIADTSVISFTGTAANQRGWLQLYGKNETIGGLASTGPGHGLVGNEAAVGSNSVLTLNVAGSYEYSGLIRDANGTGGSLAIVKAGVGRQILSGSNTYSGGTTISSGTLQVAAGGRLAATSSVIVSPGGTLQVFGLINQAATVTVEGLLSGTGSIGELVLGGTLAPGASIGTLSTGSFTWNDGGVAAFELGSGDDSSDRVMITGDFLKGTGSAFLFDFQHGGSWDGLNATTYTLATWTGTTTFTAADFTAANLAAGLRGDFQIANNSLAIIVVPEPSAAIALLTGLGALRAAQRHRPCGSRRKT